MLKLVFLCVDIVGGVFAGVLCGVEDAKDE